MPEKSGIDPVGAAACPEPGVAAAAAANVTSKRKTRRCTLILPSFDRFAIIFGMILNPMRARVKGRGVRRCRLSDAGEES
jgi:hypothetical protein